jgi:uncharacterized protein YkwD
MLCRARTRLLAAATAVLATALIATTAAATTIDVPVPIGLSPGTIATADEASGLVRAVTTASCRGAQGRPGVTPSDTLRTATLCLVNRARGLSGLKALRANSRLALAAQRHAADMARRNYFDHVSPRGRNPMARARAVGWRGSIGEVLLAGPPTLTSPAATVEAWLRSPPHRAVLLGSARVAGTGLAIRGGNARWVMNLG